MLLNCSLTSKWSSVSNHVHSIFSQPYYDYQNTDRVFHVFNWYYDKNVTPFHFLNSKEYQTKDYKQIMEDQLNLGYEQAEKIFNNEKIITISL